MDRNSVIGLILIGAILVVFSVLNTPSKEELEQARRRADSLALIQQQQHESQINKQQIEQQTINIKSKIENDSAKLQQLGVFAKSANDSLKIYTIENDLIKLQISNRGAQPFAVELKKYKTFDKRPLILFEDDSTELGFHFYTTNNRLISTANLFFRSVESEENVIVNETDTARSIRLRLFATETGYIEYQYTLRPHTYKVDFKVNFINLDSIISRSNSIIDLKWKVLLRAQEKDVEKENSYTSIFYKFNKEDVEKFVLTGKDVEKTENLRNKIKWIAYKQHFFSNVLVSNNLFESASITQRSIPDTSTRKLKVMITEAGIAFNPTLPKNELSFWFYFGPNHYQTLRKFHDDLEDLVPLGSSIVKWINRFLIIPVFNFLNKFISNYGIIILLLTIFIKLLIFPLTYKSYLSMAKMRVLKPQIDEINERIPADKPMERQQAVMALYKKVGVNPLGGCLPMLLQFPVLIAMFYFFPSSIELRQQAFLWAKDLSSYDAIISWSAHIPFITEYFGNHISLFNVLMTVTTIITMRMNNQSNASQQQIPGMQTIMYLMPIMFMFVLNKFSAGLTYYYFLANVITIIQNEIFKRSIDEEKLLHQLNENKKKPVKKSSFQARLEEAARKKGYKTK